MKPLSSFKPQAVFSDIDGTLLTSEHVVSPLTSSAIHTLTDQGVLFTISSARSPSGIRPIIKKNDFHCCTIAFSGALILDEDQNILYEKGISISDASKIIDVIEKKCPHVTWNVFTSEDWIVKDRTDPHVIHEETVVETTSIEGSLQSLSDTLMVDKILCMCDSSQIFSGIIHCKIFRFSSGDHGWRHKQSGSCKISLRSSKNSSFQYYCIRR